ncbi:protein of unknown function [Rhodovastum atsumiense]|nr:protein of unknown function [Rhodovastum atsumiense]
MSSRSSHGLMRAGAMPWAAPRHPFEIISQEKMYILYECHTLLRVNQEFARIDVHQGGAIGQTA